MTKQSNIVLSDDGTLDTVLVCLSCHEEFRYNYDPDDTESESESDYDDFVAWAIEDAESEHVCEEN